VRRTAITRRPSKAKRDFDAEYAAMLPEVLARGCEFTLYVMAASMVAGEVVLDGVPPCSQRDVGHHAKGRRARDANDPKNLICLCTAHHDYVHAHPRWARSVDLMLSRIS
jgi:hypothetical protein